MDPTSDVIYPGSILDGNSVAEGSYRQIVLERGPLTISTDFPNIVGMLSGQLINLHCLV